MTIEAPSPPCLHRSQTVSGFSLHEISFAPWTRVRDVVHGRASLVFILSGGYGETAFQNERRAATLHLHPSGANQCATFRGTGARVFGICFDEADLDLPVGEIRDGEAVGNMVRLYRSFLEPPGESQLSVEEGCWSIAYRLGRIGMSKAPPLWLVKAYEWVRDDPTKDHSLAALASECAVHPAHLSREFKRHYGTTIGDQLRLARAGLALDLLQSTNLGLDELALRCGFYDVSHLTRVLRKYVGLTGHQLRLLAQP